MCVCSIDGVHVVGGDSESSAIHCQQHLQATNISISHNNNSSKYCGSTEEVSGLGIDEELRSERRTTSWRDLEEEKHVSC